MASANEFAFQNGGTFIFFSKDQYLLKAKC